MNSARQGDRSRPKLPRAAIASGLIAAFVASAAVSWATPDGNLVVTLVPALAVGLVAGDGDPVATPSASVMTLAQSAAARLIGSVRGVAP